MARPQSKAARISLRVDTELSGVRGGSDGAALHDTGSGGPPPPAAGRRHPFAIRHSRPSDPTPTDPTASLPSFPVPRRLALLVALAVAATACGGAGGGTDTAATAPAVETAAQAPASPAPDTAPTADDGAGEPGTAGPDPGVLAISATNIDGDPVDLSVYAGSDVILWFWAPW